MDSKTRIKNFINQNFPEWKKIDYAEFGNEIDFKKDLCDIYRIKNDEPILIAYANISITGSDRPKPQLRVFLDEYKKHFLFAKKMQMRFYLLSIFTKEDIMAKGLNNFNPKDYIISIETNLDIEGARRDLRSIYDYANEVLNNDKFLKCTRANYNSDINEASFIYIGPETNPEKETFETFINIFDSRPYINSTFDVNKNENASLELGDVEIDSHIFKYLRAMRTKPFLLLAGISGTGKSRIVRQLARSCWPVGSDESKAHKPSNFEMVQVKPNWHDSSELLGYVSRIGDKPEFIAGDFLKFIAKAWENPDIPYFLCLDEMNLAPVEQYFAEYLSVIESRKLQDDKKTILTDPILNKEDEEWYYNLVASIASVEVKDEFLKNGIRIPQNLIVVGTVNMDETTYSFSRKVLDRAMTIEMNEVNLSGGLKKEETMMPYIPAQNMLAGAVEGYDVYPGNEEVASLVVNYLSEINSVLADTPFRIAYRTRNEFLIYVINAIRLAGKDTTVATPERNGIIADALDEVTSMKILSRIEGDKRKVHFLGDLTKTVKDQLNAIDGGNRSEANSTSLAKLKAMCDRLNSGYTSFWD